MPKVSADRLCDITDRLLQAAGASPDEAATCAQLIVDANLAGHDSHGVLQLPVYIDRIKKGHIVPGARYEVVKDTPTTTVVNGNWGFGFAVTRRVMETLIEKARTSNVAAATVYRQSHVGRLAAYPLMAAQAGMIGMMTADSGRSAKHVAPFGGREARLGTNPICIAIPSNLDGPLFIDMATSGVAVGKVNLAVAQGKPIPQGWILDKDGNPTTDPADLSRGGVVLPLGGSEGHKGFGLSAIIEILSGVLTGLGFGVEPTGRHNDGCFLSVFNVEAFRELEDFKNEVTEFARYLTSTPPANGFERVYYPGELEHLRAQERLRDGILVDETTWGQLERLASEYGFDIAT